MPLATLTLLLGLTPAAELAAAAGAGVRPEACRPHAGQVDATLWTRSRPPEVRRSCRALGRGFARLAAQPAQALELARAAIGVASSERAAKLLEGRALFRLGRSAEAWAVLAPFAEEKAPPLDDAPSLHDLARTALAAGALDAAERTYRLLVPRAGLLGSRQASRIALLEAASLALARGPSGVDEALGYLETARAMPLAGDRDLLLALTALALDRAGRAEQARAAAREAEGPWDLESELSQAERSRVAEAALSGTPELGASPAGVVRGRIMLLDGELHAAIALLAAGRDEALRRLHWRAFLASTAGRGPWAEHARRALARGGGRAGR
jgi:tetratricopeptide (TPR) repeat protein